MNNKEEFEKLYDFENGPYVFDWNEKLRCYIRVKTDEAFLLFRNGRQSLLPVIEATQIILYTIEILIEQKSYAEASGMIIGLKDQLESALAEIEGE